MDLFQFALHMTILLQKYFILLVNAFQFVLHISWNYFADAEAMHLF